MLTATEVTSRTKPLAVDLADAKTTLRLATDSLDTHVSACLEASADYCERVTGRACRLTVTVTQKYSTWPPCVKFSHHPVKAISSVTYYDTDGNSQTVASSNYRLLATPDGGSWLEWDDDFTFPGLETRGDAVTVTYTAGYSAITDVPESLQHAMRLKLRELFGNLDPREIEPTRRAIDGLLSSVSPGMYR